MSALLATSSHLPMLLGMNWMEPDWLLQQFGAAFFWVCLVMVFVECGLLFPFLPGDTLLLSLGVFIATGDLDVFATPPLVDLAITLVLLSVAAIGGNIAGYEIGRRIGPPLYRRNGRILKQKYFEQTEAFFEKHGKKALVIGRFVPFVRTYITVVAGVTRMDRHRFWFWSLVGAVAWVVSITLLGYFVGAQVPWLRDNIDYAILAILALSALPILVEWLRHRSGAGKDRVDQPAGDQPANDQTSV